MRKPALAFGLTVVVLILINIASMGFFARLDLTQDKRYTIMPATRGLLERLRDQVLVDVYLEGEFPAGFERLQRAVRQTLEEFQVYAGDNIQYRFIDPSANPDEKTRSQEWQRLAKRGLQPTNLAADENGKRSEKIIFPGAIVQFGGKEQAVQLLKGNQAASAQQRLNQSVEGVEYELAAAVAKVTRTKRKRIAIITGHGEQVGLEFNDMAEQLQGIFDLEKVHLPSRVSLDGFDAALILKPDSAFSEPDKYKLDQLLINGGRLAFFIETFPIRLDSIKPEGALYVPTPLNLEDQLFKYGARVNGDLVLDINSAYIPMVTGYLGNQPQTQAVPWRFYPILNTFADHPASRNLDACLAKFCSSIDTVGAPGIRKTRLAATGKYSRIMAAPIRMSFNEARIPAAPELYRQPPQAVAVLLEGSFTSLYTGRLAPQTQSTFKFKEKSLPGAVLVVSDGDFALNELNRSKGIIYPVGYDRLSGTTFGNRDLVLNALTYMLDDQGLVLARNKQVTIRPLDKPRLEKEKARWQALNLLLPLGLLLGFGLVRRVVRRG